MSIWTQGAALSDPKLKKEGFMHAYGLAKTRSQPDAQEPRSYYPRTDAYGIEYISAIGESC